MAFRPVPQTSARGGIQIKVPGNNLMGPDRLVKITFPTFELYQDRVAFYRDLNSQLDKLGYKYGTDYNYYWSDSGIYVPDYLEVDADIALVLILRYGCKRAI